MGSNLTGMLQQFNNFSTAYNLEYKNFIIISILIFLALLIVLVSKKIKVPVVVGYVFLGILISVNIIELLPFVNSATKEWYAFVLDSLDYIPTIALAFIAFTIGSELSAGLIKQMGKSIFYIVILQAFAASTLVTFGLLAIGVDLYLALIFGAIASATAPAATVMVIQEYNAEGPVTSMIMAVVGIDDAVALILFSLINPLAFILYSGQGDISFYNSILLPLLEISGSLLIGTTVGYISQKYIQILEEKTEKILIITATIIGGTGLSLLFHLSPLITNMAVGFAYRNFTKKNLGISEYLDTLTIPLYALFFILAGTKIRFDHIFSSSFLILAAVYTIGRAAGKMGGASLAATLAGASENIKKYVGLGLLPQSGVALALAYTIQKEYSSEIGLLVFNIILFTSVLTEVFGPLATKYALNKAHETHER